MKNRNFKIIVATLLLSGALALGGCSEGGKTEVTGGDTVKPALSDNSGTDTVNTEAQDTENAADTNAVTEGVTDPPDTTAKEFMPSVEEPGNVPDSYREDGESGIKIIGRNGHYMGLMGCWGTYECCDSYIAAVNKAATLLDGVNVYSMVIPTSSEFYVPEDITGFTASQKDKIDYIAAGLSGVTNVDAYSALAAKTDEYIYTRTDHHWQPLGAYYAAKAFAEAGGFTDTFASLSDYKQVTKEGYMGSLYNYSKSENLYNDPEPFTMYISPNDEALKTTYYDTAFQNGYESDLFVSRDAGAFYCSFLGSDDRIAKIETDCKNGRTLVIFKESYGNGVVPFLTTDFETIYVCDVRYFDIDAMQFCKDVGATDLLFATCTFTPAGNTKVEQIVG